MAFQKEVTAPSGVVGNFWVIKKATFHRCVQKTEVELACFVNEEACSAHKKPIAGIQTKTRWVNNPTDENMTLDKLYAAVKALDSEEEATETYFADAESV